MTVAVRLACAVLLTVSAAAWADVGRDEAAAIARRQGDGRVLSVERIESARRPVWRVKLLTPRGEVRVIFIDAASGQPA